MGYREEADLGKFKKVDTSSWEGFKESVFIRLINSKHIQKYAKDIYHNENQIVYSKWMDLAVTFSVQETVRENNEKILVSHILTEWDLEQYGIQKEDIMKQALLNMATSRKRRIMQFRYFTVHDNQMYPIFEMPQGMKMQIGGANNTPSGFVNDVDFNFETEHEQENILIITYKNGYFGASLLCVPSILNEVYERFNENYYILPMSTHQLMCVRNTYASHKGQRPTYEVEDDLLSMVEDINDRKDVCWKDILTYKIYYYAGDDGHVVIPVNP